MSEEEVVAHRPEVRKQKRQDGHAWDQEDERRWNRWLPVGCFFAFLLMVGFAIGIVILLTRP